MTAHSPAIGVTPTAEPGVSETRIPSELDDFLFDLRGYLVLKNAVDQKLMTELDRAFDEFPNVADGEWLGNAQRRGGDKGEYALHNCVEAGKPFEVLIDHPSWIEYVRRYASGTDDFMAGLFIDECFASRRWTGGYAPIHSGGYQSPTRTVYAYRDGVFRCCQVNIILALTDIGPDDGPTMVVPGSHKSHFPYPGVSSDHMADIEEAKPVCLNKGDALLFTDSIMHGSDSRRAPGERRVTIYRYGPAWGATRYGYAYSDELLARLTPARRQILQPITPRKPPTR
jgi:hypothetical protein